LLVDWAGVDGRSGRRSGMCLSIRVLGIGIRLRRRSIRRGVLGCWVALDALVSSSATATAAAGAASKAAARQLGAAAYASRYARNHGYENEASDDDCDNDRPSV